MATLVMDKLHSSPAGATGLRLPGLGPGIWQARLCVLHLAVQVSGFALGSRVRD